LLNRKAFSFGRKFSHHQFGTRCHGIFSNDCFVIHKINDQNLELSINLDPDLDPDPDLDQDRDQDSDLDQNMDQDLDPDVNMDIDQA